VGLKSTVHFSASYSTTSFRPEIPNSPHRSGPSAILQVQPNQLPDLCSLDQAYRSVEAYAVSMGERRTVVAKGLLRYLRRKHQIISLMNRPIPKLRKAPQPPLSHLGATADSDRAKRPPLAEPSATGEELSPGDRGRGLGNFGIPTGELGTVEPLNRRTKRTQS
jgi:hypothetical protein